MKKLMTLLSAATVALGLYAYNDTGTSFEGASEGAFLLNTADDLPIGALGTHTDLWATNGVLALNVISNETACPHHDAYANVPDQFKSEQNSKYLSIKSTFGNTLTRYINTNGSTESIGNGLYFDSMVKFTSFDQDPTNIAAIATEFAGAKIAVWVQTTEDESATNLYVWAGQFYGDQGETRGVAYKCKNIGDVDAWHRLTIKAIGTIYPGVAQMAPAFVVYVDGEVVGRQNDAEGTGIELSKLGNAYIDLFSNKKSIYPSLQQGTVGTSLASATFDGQGEIDDVVFTATAPDFAKDSEYGEVNWDIADFTSVKVDGTECLNDGKYLVDLTAGNSNVTFNVEYAYGKAGPATQAFEFTPGSMGPFTLVANNASAIVVVGNVTHSCADIAAVQAAVATATADDQAVVTLLGDVADDSLDFENSASYRIKLDLNGKSIPGIVAPKGAWIFDSTGVTNGVVAGRASLAGDELPSIIEAGVFNHKVMLGAGSIISNGCFIASNNTAEDLNGFLPADWKSTKEFATETIGDVDYLTIQEKQGTVFTVTLTWGANETPVLYQINEDSPVDFSSETSPFVISDVGSGTNVSFIVANADGAKKGYTVTVAGANAAIDATGATFGWPEYLGEAVSGAYQIDDANDLVMLQKGVFSGLATASTTFKQTANIDMTGVANFYGIGWFESSTSFASVPTGVASDGTTTLPFAGTYDGQGYTISNVTIVRHNYAGVFNNVSGTVKNLTVQDIGFSGTCAEWGCAIVGNAASGSLLENLTAVTSSGFNWGDSANHNVAGVVVRPIGAATIRGCVNNANISATAKRVGGIAAFVGSGATGTVFDSCTNNAALVSTDGTRGVGGILGCAEGGVKNSPTDADTIIRNCVDFGSETAQASSGHAGAIVGSNWNASYTYTDDGGNTFKASTVDCGYANNVVFGRAYAVDAGIDGEFDYLTTVKAADLAAGNTYVLLTDIAAGTVFTLQAAGDTIAFDTNGHTFGGTVDSVAALVVSSATAGTVTTYSAATAVAKVGATKYATLADAVAAANAGDTVEVLADCTVAEPITFTKGIMVTNDYTVTLTAAYALRFANGTSTPVTFCGTGAYEQPSGVSGSPLLIGNNENKSSYGMADTFTGSLVLESGDITILHAKNNVIKVENGPFVMNGGNVAGGKCGIKADSENGNATTSVTINGGTVSNTTAAVATVVSGTGSATVTITGGEITGPFTYGAGTTLTIPGTSTAKFDRDQSAFCASGYATTLSDGWYVVGPATYTITFEAGANATVDPATTNYTINSGAITLPTAVPTGVGVTFGGWTNETITTAIKTYTPAVGDGNFTLYAKWDAVVGPTYPTYLENADADVKAQYLEWKALYGADTGSAYEGEFLLNVAPDTTGATLDATAVSISGTTVTIDINRGNLNGVPYVKKASTVAGLATAPKEAITIVPADQVQDLDNGGRITLTGESGTTMFYQIGVQSTPLNQN